MIVGWQLEDKTALTCGIDTSTRVGAFFTSSKAERIICK